MAYRVEVTPYALRQLSALPGDVQRRLRPRIEALADHPRPRGIEKLRGEADIYRLRVGDYRVVYQLHDDRLLVLIIRIGHRREVYRGLT